MAIIIRTEEYKLECGATFTTIKITLDLLKMTMTLNRQRRKIDLESQRLVRRMDRPVFKEGQPIRFTIFVNRIEQEGYLCLQAEADADNASRTKFDAGASRNKRWAVIAKW